METAISGGGFRVGNAGPNGKEHGNSDCAVRSSKSRAPGSGRDGF